MHVCAVDRAMHPTHGSTVDRTEGVCLDLISAVDQRSNDPERVQAGVAAGLAGVRWRAVEGSSARL
jgi:hypothetical protein